MPTNHQWLMLMAVACFGGAGALHGLEDCGKNQSLYRRLLALGLGILACGHF